MPSTTITHATNIYERPENRAPRLEAGQSWAGPWEIVGVVAVSKDKSDEDSPIVPQVIWKREINEPARATRRWNEGLNGEEYDQFTLSGTVRIAESLPGEFRLYRRDSTGKEIHALPWPFLDNEPATEAELEEAGFVVERPRPTRSPEPRC